MRVHLILIVLNATVLKAIFSVIVLVMALQWEVIVTLFQFNFQKASFSYVGGDQEVQTINAAV